MTKLTTVGSKKAAELKLISSERLSSTTKRANFDLVAAGVCPHDNARLGDEIRTSGVGVTSVCEKCQHRWYLNRKIKSCKCLTCSAEKRKRSADKWKVVGNVDTKSTGGSAWESNPPKTLLMPRRI